MQREKMKESIGHYSEAKKELNPEAKFILT